MLDVIAILASFVNFLLPSERVRGGLRWGKKITTPARIARDLKLNNWE
jgi:hypothetical protein